MRLSVQLYTVRDQLSTDPKGTYSRLRDIGIEYVEGGGSFGASSAEEDRALLDEFGLKASGSHVGLSQLEKDLDAAIADAKTLGVPYVIVPWLDASTYSAGWAEVAKRLEPVGQKVQDAGLELAYHNHDFEFKNEGTPGLEIFYETADPGLVKAELDLAWVSIGGGDPVAWIQKLSPRLPLVHLKDYNPELKPQWRPAGQGIIHWDAILEAISHADVQYGVIELDESPGDPLDAVQQSVEFFRSKGIH